MRGARLVSLLVSLGAVSCNAVLGLDPRELAADGAPDDASSIDDVFDDASPDDVAPDAAMLEDEGTASDTDATPVDAATSDGANTDTAKSDTTTTTTTDTGTPTKTETGAVDTGTTTQVDTGTVTPDTGTPDTGTPDTGAPDVGPCDGATPNACGGCAALLVKIGTSCNCGGFWQCEGTNDVACSRVACEGTSVCCSRFSKPLCTCATCCDGIEP